MTWDNAREFSFDKNPNGPWIYGYLDKDDQFIPYNTMFQAGEGIIGWALDDNPDAAGNVTVNLTSNPIERFGVWWEPGQVCIHPGASGHRAVVRWVSPMAGSFRISATFNGQCESGSTAKIHVIHRGSPLFNGTIEGFVGRGLSRDGRTGTEPTQTCDAVVKAVAGDMIDIVVGDIGDMNAIGHVSIDAAISALARTDSGSESTVRVADRIWNKSTFLQDAEETTLAFVGADTELCDSATYFQNLLERGQTR